MSSLLELRNCSKNFGGIKAVSNFSFDISKGEIVGLIGPNGAGKSTVLNLIAGLYPVTRGQIYFSGIEIQRMSDFERARAGIGRTFQIPKVFNGLTVEETINLATWHSARHRSQEFKTDAILTKVQLADKENVLADTLNLSQRKRLEIAKALAISPKLLLLDEVLAGLNLAEMDNLLSVISELRKDGITVIIIEHIIKAIVRISDRVVVMHHGEKIAEDKPDKITSDPRVIQAYLGSKFAQKTYQESLL